MWRRLYLSFPDAEHTFKVTQELEQEGIKREQMHVMDSRGDKLSGLPAASKEQKNDKVWFIEQLYWYSNLAIFALALIGLIVALVNGATGWSLFAIAIMATTFLMGNYFASEIPHAHLNEMKEPMQHGDVVLMVDLPAEQVSKIDHEIAHRHPEVRGHVVGWFMPGWGL